MSSSVVPTIHLNQLILISRPDNYWEELFLEGFHLNKVSQQTICAGDCLYLWNVHLILLVSDTQFVQNKYLTPNLCFCVYPAEWGDQPAAVGNLHPVLRAVSHPQTHRDQEEADITPW